MFEGKNLLAIHASCINKYTTTVMKVLFTTTEREHGYIIEGNSSSKKTALDQDRVELLKQAIRMKYKIKDLEWESYWAKLKKVACGTCAAASKNLKEQQKQN